MKSNIFKELKLYFAGSIGVSIISFVISLLYSRMFSTTDYGLYSLTFSLFSLVYQFLTGWMSHSILRFYSEYKSKSVLKTFESTLFVFHFLISICSCITLILLATFAFEDKTIKNMVYGLAFVYFFEGTLLILNLIMRADGNAKQYNINTFLNSLIKSLSLLFIYYVLNYKKVEIIIICLLITDLLQCIWMLKKYRLNEHIALKYFDYKMLKYVLNYGFPLVGVSLIYWILNLSDRYIINLFWTVEDVGTYSYGYQMGNSLFYTLTNFIMLGAYPNIVKEWGNMGRIGAERLVKRYMEIYFYILMPATIGIGVIGKPFSQIFFGEQYWPSYKVFIITCISFAIFGLMQYSNKAWELTKNTKMILKLNFLAASVNIILNFLFVPVFGYEVAAITTLASFLIYLFTSLFFSRKIFTFGIEAKFFLKVFTASILMAFFVEIVLNYITLSFINLIITVIVGGFIYFITLLILKDVTAIDVSQKLRSLLKVPLKKYKREQNQACKESK